MNTLLAKTPLRSLTLGPRFSSPDPVNSVNMMNSSAESTHRAFQLKLNPLTGNSEWVVIDENDDDQQQQQQEPLLATTSYLDMLNDSRRNRAYRQAIDKTITKPCRVLDIGAGTGLLSMMAARAMGCSSDSEGMVTACESYLPMLKLMRKVVHVNGMSRNINIINKRSDELVVGHDLPSRADVLVSEILDSELLGEGLIPSLQHAHDMLLVENPSSVPYRATTYGQLVESTSLRKLHDLYSNEEKASDGIRLVPTGLDNALSVKTQQYPMHCDALSEPFEIFEFDFWRRPDSHGETQLQIKTTEDGQVHAVISWWVLQLDREATVFYSTAPRWIDSPFTPSSKDWCDHWKQCVWFVPSSGLSTCRGDTVLFKAVHTETNISYDLKAQDSSSEARHLDTNDADFQLTLPPERVAIYGNKEWRLSMRTAVENALQQRLDPLCVVADDSVFLSLLVAHLSRTARVMSLFPGLRDSGVQYLQTVADANGISIDRLEVPPKRKSHLTMDDTHQMKVDLLIGEPYYYGNDGMLPWQNLHFWKERTMLESVLSKDVVIMPCKGILRACAMSLPNLWKSHCCLKKIEGFDHVIVNTVLGACGDLPPQREGPCLPFYVWQCGEKKELSDSFTVMELDFSKPISQCHGTAQVNFTAEGICHGFALWIDWVLDAENSIVVSTGPAERYWKQGVKLLSKPVSVGIQGLRDEDYSRAVIEAYFDPIGGQLDIKHVFS
ncbi:hypothetical protein ACFE04_028870 [Oxalis oulophora]